MYVLSIILIFFVSPAFSPEIHNRYMTFYMTVTYSYCFLLSYCTNFCFNLIVRIFFIKPLCTFPAYNIGARSIRHTQYIRKR